MRHTHLTFPWFLALVLSCLSACDELFRVPACDFDQTSVLCMQQMRAGMGGQQDGALPDGPAVTPDLAPPRLGTPVSFTKVAQAPLSAMRNWVGIRSGNIILFAKQSSITEPARLEIFTLGRSGSTTTGWDLLSNMTSCSTCPGEIKNTNLITDYVLTGKSKFFVVKPDFAYVLNPDGSLPANSINENTNKLAQKYRPFISPDLDVISFQKQLMYKENNININGNISHIEFYGNSSIGTSVLINRRPDNLLTYYAIGNLDPQGLETSGNEVLIFEDKALRGAFHLDEKMMAQYDGDLTAEINAVIVKINGNNMYPLRSAFISDLNRDGYMELIYARHNQIFATTYNPNAKAGSKFTTDWPNPLFEIDQDHTATLSAADLDGDGDPELAIETSNSSDNPTFVYFYVNNKY